MSDPYGVKTVAPGSTYQGVQGFSYGAGASKETVGARQIRMNILPMPADARARVHHHKDIETIAYLLEGQCTVFFGNKLEHHHELSEGDQIFIPGNVPHAPSNRSGTPCTWIVTHAAGSDQDGIVLLPELDALLAEV